MFNAFRKTFCAMGLLSALALSSCGGTQRDADQAGNAANTVKEAAAAPEIDVITHDGDFVEIQQFETAQGISVWLVTEPSIPIVSINVAWRGGGASDPAGLEGLANAVTYHMNEGAGDMEALAFQTRMEELNMSFGCSAGRDWTSCSAGMLRENAGEAMDLVALAMNQPRFDDGPFERFQREALISIKRRVTSPQFLASQAMEAALYPDHPYARERSAASIEALSPQLARDYKDDLMVREGMLVTAVGAISPQALAPMIDKAFGSLPARGDIDLPGPVELNPPLAAPEQVDLPQPQSFFYFMAPGLQRDHPDFFAAYVLNYSFGGGGFESRLMKELRIAQGLTYGIGTGLGFGGELASWTGRGQTRNETAGRFLEGIVEQMRQIADEGVSEAELADAKSYLTGAYPLSFDSNSKIAGQMMSVRQQELGIDYFDRRNAAVEAVTLEDVNRVAGEWLRPERFSFIVVGEPDGINAPGE